MVERKDGWTINRAEDGSILYESKPLDKKIIAQMPPEGSKVFINHSLIDIIAADFRKLVRSCKK